MKRKSSIIVVAMLLAVMLATTIATTASACMAQPSCPYTGGTYQVVQEYGNGRLKKCPVCGFTYYESGYGR